MPLQECPWMVARCPHYKQECKEPESKHCLYVKNTTRSALTALAQLNTLRQIENEPALDARIKELETFVARTRERGGGL